MILFEKFGQHQPLNRQSERYRREGIDLSAATLANQVGACTTALQPLHALIERHVLAAERLHGDDTTVPILAKGKTVTGRIWTYVRDDCPLAVTHRRRRSITPRAIESTSTPFSIFKPPPASCRPTPIAGTMGSTIPLALREAVLAHARRKSSSWPISLPMHGAERTQRRSRRLRERRSCIDANAVEDFFDRLSGHRLKRGVFRSVVDL